MLMCVMESSSNWEILRLMVEAEIILRTNQLMPCFWVGIKLKRKQKEMRRDVPT